MLAALRLTAAVALILLWNPEGPGFLLRRSQIPAVTADCAQQILAVYAASSRVCADLDRGAE